MESVGGLRRSLDQSDGTFRSDFYCIVGVFTINWVPSLVLASTPRFSFVHIEVAKIIFRAIGRSLSQKPARLNLGENSGQIPIRANTSRIALHCARGVIRQRARGVIRWHNAMQSTEVILTGIGTLGREIPTGWTLGREPL